MDKLSEEIRKEGDKTQDDEYYVGPSALTLHNWADKVAQLEAVLRELVGYIKHEAEHAYYQEVIACDMEDFTDEAKEEWIENWYDNFSNDVKELCVAASESSRE